MEAVSPWPLGFHPSLVPGQMIVSENGLYAAILGYDGNFVVTNTNGVMTILYQSYTFNQAPSYYNWL